MESKNELNDLVNRPKHYCNSNRKECIVEMRDMFGVIPVIFFCVLNHHKYLYRRSFKGTYELDTQKANWYKQKAFSLLNDSFLARLFFSMFYPQVLTELYEDIEDHMC